MHDELKPLTHPVDQDHEPGVFIAEPDPPSRRQTAAWAAPALCPVLTFPTLGHLVSGVPAMRPGCILLGICPGREEELESIAHLPARGFHHPVIVLAEQPDMRVAVRAMRSGALNVLDKATAADELPAAIEEAIVRGNELRRHTVLHARASQRFSQLSEGEREVLEMILRGRSNKAIAEGLSVSVRTIEVRRSKMMRKMHARSLAELVQMAVLVRSAPDG